MKHKHRKQKSLFILRTATAAFLAAVMSFSPLFPIAPDMFLALENSIHSARKQLAQKSDFAPSVVDNLKPLSFPALTFTRFQSASSLRETLSLFTNSSHVSQLADALEHQKVAAQKGDSEPHFHLAGGNGLGAVVYNLLPTTYNLLVGAPHAKAAVVTWDGGGTDGTCGGGVGDGNKWSCGANWTGDTAPTNVDVATFDGTSTKNATIDVAINVLGIDINTGYTGTITQGSGNTVTFSSSGYAQDDGTFTGGDSAISATQDGGFTLAGGTFTNTSGGLNIMRNFTISGGTFTNTGKTVTFIDDNENADTTVTCSGTLGGTIVITKNSGGDFVLASGCTIDFGASPTTTLTSGIITNNGTITIASGTWTMTMGTGSFTNNGTITHSGDGWDSNISLSGGGFINSATGTVTYAGTTMTIENNFTQSGTFDLTGKTITFDGVQVNSDTTLTCSGSLGGTVVITKGNGDFILSSGCSIELSAAPTTSLGGIGTYTNNGTIVIPSGTWTINMDGANFTNNGTITHSGSGWDINNASSIANGFINAVGGTVTYAGTSLTIENNFTQNGTFDLTGKTITFDDSNDRDDTTVACSGTLGGTIVVTKDANANFIVDTGCSVSLGANPVWSLRNAATYTNNGTITVASGTWTISGNNANAQTLTNNGTITHSGSGWDFNNSGFVNSSGATVTYSGTSITVHQKFTQNGTLDLTGKTITFNSSTGGTAADTGLLACNTAIQGNVVVNMVDLGSGPVFTLAGNCTVQGNFTRTDGVISNPASAFTLTVQGNVVIDTTDTTGGSNFTWALGGTGNNTFDINAGDLDGHLTINKSAGKATLNDNLTLNATNLTITAGQFDISGRNLTFSGGGTFSNSGTLMLNNTETLTSFTNDTDSGTILVKGTTSQTGFNTGNSYNNLNINDGLVGYWKFDETSAGTFADSSGYGNTGTGNGAAGTNNTPQPTDTKPTLQFTNPKALDFDGTDDYVDVGTSEPLVSLQVPMTITAWVKADSFGAFNVVVGQYLNTSSHQLIKLLRFDNGELRYYASTAAGNSQADAYSGSFSVGTWYFVHAVVSGSISSPSLRLGANGIEESFLMDALSSTPDTAVNVYIGSDENGISKFNGQIDDVRIYNRALTEQEINSLAAGSQPATATATYTLNAALDVNGDFTLASGGIDTAAGFNYSVNVAGNWFNYGGVFTPRSGTVTLDGTASGKTLLSGRQDFNNLTISGTGGAWTLADRLDITGTYTQSAGTLSTSSSNYNVTAADFDQTGGTFTANSSTLTLNSSSNQTVTLTSPQYNLQVEDPTESGLVGYWKFDEGQGTTAADSSSSGNTGTLTNAPKWTTTVPSSPGPTFDNPYALDFDGTDDYVSLGRSPDFGLTGEVTFSIWVRPKIVTGIEQIIGDYSSTQNANNYAIWRNGTGLRIVWANAVIHDVAGVFAVGTWTHIVGVRSGSTGNWTSRAYVNSSESSATSATNPSGGDYQAVIGRLGESTEAAFHFEGMVDDARIYNRALSAAEVTNLASGTYADGDNSTATFTLNTALDVNNNLRIQSGILSPGSNSITVGSEFLNTAGSSGFSAGTSTLTMDATSGTKDILSGGSSLYNLTLNDGGGTTTFELEDALDVNNNLTITGGTLDVKSGENNSVTVGNNFTNSDTFTARSGTVTFDATDSGNTFNPGASSFYGVTFNGSGGVWDLTSNALDVDNALTITNGTFDLNGQNLTTTGATFSNSGTLRLQGGETLTGFTNDTDSGTVMYDGTTNRTGLATGSSYHNLNINDGLVGYWKFDEGVGTSVEDSSGYEKDGTVGAASWSTDVPAVKFSNPSSQVGSITVSNYTMPAYGTVSFWAKNNDETWEEAQPITVGNTQFWVHSKGGTKNIELFAGGTNTQTVSITSSISEWNHYVWVLDGASSIFYVNGSNASTASTSAAWGSATNLYFGWDGGSRIFSGTLDDVRIYNKALSATEISRLASGNQPASATATYTLNANLDVNNDLTLATGGINTSGSSFSLAVGGNWHNYGGVFTPNSSTVTLDATDSGNSIGSGGQSFAGLTFNGSGGAWDLDGAATVTSALTITNGTFDLNSYNLTATGASFSNAGTIRAQGGETVTSLTFDTDSGTAEYDGTGSYTSLPFGNSYNHLTFNGSGGSWQPNGNVAVNGNLNILAGTFDLNGFDLALGGSSTFSNAGTLKLVGDEALTNFTNDTDSGTVNYTGSGTTGLIAGNSYFGLTFSAGSWDPAANLSIAGTLNNLATFLNTSSLTFTLNGTNQTFTFGSFTLGTLDIIGSSGTVTLGSNFTVNTLLQLAAGRTLQLVSYLITLAGNLTNSGTIAASTGGYIVKAATNFYIADENFDEDAAISLGVDRIYLSILDEDGNNDGASADTISNAVAVTCANDSETVSLTETGNATEVFRHTAGILTAAYDGSATNNDGTLECIDGETITATYTDPQDNTDTESDTSLATTDTIPTAPSSFTCSSASSTSASCAWTDNSNNEDGFRIRNSSNTVLTSPSAGASSATVTGLTKGTSHTLHIVAFNDAGNSSNSNTSTFTTPAEPTAPSNFTGQALSSTSIRWTWQDNSNDETGFKLYNQDGDTLIKTLTASGSGDADPYVVNSDDTLSYTETGLTAGTTYRRYVTAFNDDGDSAASNAKEITTLTSAPTAASLTSPGSNALINDNTPTFQFNAAVDSDDGLDTYTLRVASLASGASLASLAFPATYTNASSPSTRTHSTPTMTVQYFNQFDGNPNNDYLTVTLKSALSDGTYTWRVTATDTGGNSAASSSRSFTLDATSPTVSISGAGETAQTSPTLTISATDSRALKELSLTLEEAVTLLGVTVSYRTVETATYPLSGTSGTVFFTPRSPLEAGKQYRVTAAAADEAGNTATQRTTLTILTAEELARRQAEQLDPDATPIDDIIDTLRELLPDSLLDFTDLEEQALLRRHKQAELFSLFTDPFERAYAYLLATNERLAAIITDFLNTIHALTIQTSSLLAAWTDTTRSFLAQFFVSTWRGAQLIALGTLSGTINLIVSITDSTTSMIFAGARAFNQGVLTLLNIDVRERLAAFLPKIAIPAYEGAGVKEARQATGEVIASSAKGMLALLTQARDGVRLTLKAGQETRVREGLRNRQRVNEALTAAVTPAKKIAQRTLLASRHWYEIVFDADEPTRITNLRITQLSPTSAVIEWDTNHLTRSTKVNYGTTTSYGQEASSDELATHHRIALTDLQPATTYYFEVMNQNGDYVFDAYYTLTTLPAGSEPIEEPLAPQDAVIRANDQIPMTNDQSNPNDQNSGESIVVRKEPNPEAQAITTVNPGDRFRALTARDGWISILLPTGQQGWVQVEYVQLTAQEQPTGVNR